MPTRRRVPGAIGVGGVGRGLLLLLVLCRFLYSSLWLLRSGGHRCIVAHTVSAAADSALVSLLGGADHFGELRLGGGKWNVYDTDIRVPMRVVGPGVAAGSSLGLVVRLPPPLDAVQLAMGYGFQQQRRFCLRARTWIWPRRGWGWRGSTPLLTWTVAP